MPGPISSIKILIISGSIVTETRADFPYFTALSSRLASARPKATGRHSTSVQRGTSSSATSQPASAISLHTRSSNEPISTVVLGSEAASSRMKDRVELTICCISSRSRSIFTRSSSSSTNSARKRRRVIGVPRSWAMAPSIWVRSVTKRRIRFCITLKACAVRRTSSGPVSGIAGACTSVPSTSAARESCLSGAVIRRTSRAEKNTTAASITSMESPSRAEKKAGDGETGETMFSHFPPPRFRDTTIRFSGAGSPCTPE